MCSDSSRFCRFVSNSDRNRRGGADVERRRQLRPVVAVQVSHFRQAPLRTMVKLLHSGQDSPTSPFIGASAP